MFRLAVAFTLLLTGAAAARTEKAIVAGGCFWCVEADMESVPGVRSVVSGYTGGTLTDPTYDNHEGHFEAVEITFDPARLSYADLIALFLRSIDVTDAGGQFCDRGSAYRSAIFATTPEQEAAAKAAIAEAEAQLDRKIVTPVLPASTFWKAEAYHQDYYRGSKIILTRAGPKKQSNAYTFYRKACGRDARVRDLWGDQAFSH